MLMRDTSEFHKAPTSFALTTTMQRVRPELWQIMTLVSLVAGVGSSWQVLAFRAELLSPLVAAITMSLATFAGWYVWGFFTHMADKVLFGGHADYRGTLNAFGRAYAFQALFLFTFARPLGWLWGWIALYVTIAAWGVIGPRRLGMRTWQAILAATLGMLLWLACLLVLTLVLTPGGTYTGIGVFQV